MYVQLHLYILLYIMFNENLLVNRQKLLKMHFKPRLQFEVWLTVYRSSMWNKKPTRCHLVLHLFLLYKLLNMFQATLCPSSGADNLVVFLPRVV